MTMGIGKKKIITSLIILATAVAMYRLGRLMQTPSVMVTSQLMAIGLHEKMQAKKMPTVYPPMNTIADHVAILNQRWGDSRR